MAENRWISTSSTVYSTGANWSLGAKPGAGDDVVVGAGTADILSGFDANGQTFGVRSFHRHRDYTGNIGTSAAPLVLATEAPDIPMNPQSSKGKVIVRGPGEFYYASNTWSTTAAMFIDTDTQDTAIEVNGVIDRFNCIKGRIVGLSNFVPGTVRVAYRTNPASDVHLTLQGSQAMSLLQIGGEVLQTGTSSFGTLNIAAGKCQHGTSGGGITALTQTGGTFIHLATTTTIEAFILGGVCDYSQDVRAKTVTNLTAFPGAKFLQNANITVTNGGTVLPITDIEPASF